MKSTVVLFLSSLLVIVLLVLSIACANVANLLFAQAAVRQREMAVRLALGATRGRLQRQMLLESVMMAFGGGVVGVALSLWAAQALSTLRLPAPVPLDLNVDVDWRVLLFAFTLSLVSGILLGAAPAWAASRPLLTNALKGEDALARPGRRLTMRSVLVIAQIAMSVVLLSVTMLFLRSLESASAIDIGFRPHNLLLSSIDPRVHGYAPQRTAAFLKELRERVAALPGVDSAVCTDVPPLSGGNRSDGFTVAGQPSRNQAPTFADLYMVTPGYFATLGIAQLVGRDFSNETADGPKTAIINRAFADRLFAGVNPIGQHVNGGNFTYQIIGVVDNVKSRTLGEVARPIIYSARFEQSIADDPSLMGYTLIVHTQGRPGALAEAVRRQIHALDPAMAVYNEETMDEHVRTAYCSASSCGCSLWHLRRIGVVLAAVGLYGVMSFAVSRRTREIGIRMAMGARPATVERLVLRQGMVLTMIAIALGWPVAWTLSKLAASFLYGIQPHDALTFTIVPPFLVAIALAACWLPARRAARVDPMQALRTE